MKKLLLLLLFIGLSANAQFLRSNLTREQYAANVDNYKPGSQVSVLLGKNTVELAYSYTDIITWGGSIERIQKRYCERTKTILCIFRFIGW